MANEDLIKKVNQAGIIIIGSNFTLFLVIMFLYSRNQNIWFLIGALIILSAAIVFALYMNKMKEKIRKSLSKDEANSGKNIIE